MLEPRSIIESESAALADLPDARGKPPWLQRSHTLPFEALSSDEFEVLCFLLISRECPNDRVFYYGKTGDLGRDIVHVTTDDRVRFVQCKRYKNKVNRDDVLGELAKLVTNLHRGRYPQIADEVAWYIVPELTNTALDLLQDQAAWRILARGALSKHLRKSPSRELVEFAEEWWPRFDPQHALTLTERLKRHRDLIDEFFSLRYVVSGDAEEVSQKVADKVVAALPGTLSPLLARVGTRIPELVPSDAVDRSCAQAVLHVASRPLMSWPQTLGRNVWIDRPQLNEVEERLVKELDGSTTLLLGPPGSGKSAMLARLASILSSRDELVLAIKADTLPNYIDSEARLSEYLRLPALVTACAESLSKVRPFYVLIDQVDALGDLVDLKSQRLDVLLEIIHKLSALCSVHVVISCREFEYHHDARLGTIDGEPLRLEPPPWEKMEAVLKDHGIDPAALPERSRELLRTPHHLKLYLDRCLGAEGVPTFSTLQELLDDLWDRQILSKANATERIKFIARLAEWMAVEEELWVPAARFSAEHSLIKQLIADGLLQCDDTGRRIGFRHQSFFEHARARLFVEQPEDLVPYVVERQNGLFVRPVLWGALNYLRATSRASYEHAMRGLVAANLRPHLQYLLIEFLGECESPTDLEQYFLQKWLDDQRYCRRAIRAVSGRQGWFERLVDTHLPGWMTEVPGDCWPGLRFLIGAIPFAESRCVDEVRKRWLPDRERDELTLHFYQESRSWDEGVVRDVSRIIARQELIDYLPMHLAKRVSESRPDLAPRIIRSEFDRRLAVLDASTNTGQSTKDSDSSAEHLRLPDRRYETLIERSSGFWQLPELATAAPVAFLEALWPWFLQVVDRVIHEPHHVVRKYRESWSLGFDLEGERFDNNPVMRAFEGAIRDMAKSNPDVFDGFLAKWWDKDAHIVQQLLCRGVIERSAANPDTGVDFITADPRRLCLGGHEDEFGDSRRLLSVLGTLASDNAIRRLELAIKAWSGYVEEAGLDDPGTRFARRKRDRAHRLYLLRSLPTERLLPEVSALIDSELVALNGHFEEGRKITKMTCDAPMMSADQMERGADDDVLNLLEVLESPKSERDWRSGRDWEAEQVAREFKSFAKRQPHRVARLLPRLPATRMEPPVAAAISGIGESDDYATAELFSLILDLEKLGYRGAEFRGDAAQALGCRAIREAGLPPDITDLLERWLTKWRTFDSRENHGEDRQDRLPHSLLWGHLGSFVLPHGSYWLLRALTYGYLRREPAEYDAWLASLERQLERPESSYTWKASVQELEFLGRAKNKARVAQFLQSLFERYPEVRDSIFGMRVLVQCRWQIQSKDYATHLERLRNGPWPLAGLAYGELLGLSYLFGEGDDWTTKAIQRTLELEYESEKASLIWTGLSHALAHLYRDSKADGRATALFEQLARKNCEHTSKALMYIFANDNALPANEETQRLLKAVAGSPQLLRNAEHDWLFEVLLKLVAYSPALVHDVCKAYFDAIATQPLPPRSAVYFAEAPLIDISLRLQRLGEGFRERGLALFERLLELGIGETEAMLLEMDGRLRRHASPIRRRHRRTQRSAT